jgi:hypothetical protein
MGNKPTSSIYSMVEKAYFRLQAGDVLTRSLEDGSTAPAHEMIQEMVMAGPQSLEALREILGETSKRKAQVYDDLNQVTNQLLIIMKDYGLNLERLGGSQALLSLSEQRLIELMNEEQVGDPDTRSTSLHVLRDSQDLMVTLKSKIALLENIETYLQDWLWGLTYQHIRHGDGEVGQLPSRNDVQ